MAKGVEKLRCPTHGSEESRMQTGRGQGQVIASKVMPSVVFLPSAPLPVSSCIINSSKDEPIGMITISTVMTQLPLSSSTS